MEFNELRKKLSDKGLKITPQRIAVYEAVLLLKNHPAAENIIDHVRKHYPNIAIGTVYKVLDTLCEKKLISRIHTDRDIMRYDAVTEVHHHLHSKGSDRIEDFFDKGLDELLRDYFKNKQIPDFIISEIKIHISGEFSDGRD
jgi:Fur family transcriptional regulator, peroxide stress response regulator